MNPNLIPNILAVSLFIAAMFIALRAFYIYTRSRSPRLFILGLSMGIISLTAAADFFSSNITIISLNTDWFLYIGQAASLLFIFLSFLRDTDTYFRNLMRWQIFVSVLLIGLLVLSPTLPNFPNTIIRAILSGSRCVICFGIFFFYISAFMTKQTRFGLLMGISFMLLAFGYLLIFQQYFVTNSILLDDMGDITRMAGLVTLLTAVIGG